MSSCQKIDVPSAVCGCRRPAMRAMSHPCTSTMGEHFCAIYNFKYKLGSCEMLVACKMFSMYLSYCDVMSDGKKSDPGSVSACQSIPVFHTRISLSYAICTTPSARQTPTRVVLIMKRTKGGVESVPQVEVGIWKSTDHHAFL